MSVIKALLLPPGCILIGLVAGMLVRRRAPRAGQVILVLSVAAFYAASTPLIAGYTASVLERSTSSVTVGDGNPQAVVVIAGDVRKGDPPTLGALTLDRLAHGARLGRKTGLPILLSGGPVRPVDEPSARIMARVLREDFGLAPRWIEDQSRSTWENALESAAIMKDAGVQRILLVTQIWHMPRAAISFRAQGLRVVPAATTDPRAFDPDWRAMLPSASALLMTYFVSHELLGLLWYDLRYV